MTLRPGPQKQQRRQIPPGWQDPLRQRNPLVSPRWLLRSFAISLGAALFCAYLTLCLLFYQGGWQLLFHPSHEVKATPGDAGMRFDDIRFDATETGQTQLTGWWIPADSGARYSGSTLLYLHGGTGSLGDTLPRLKALHALGINIFAVDYRGFGHSVSLHPSETSVSEDADAAVAYLTDTRRVGVTSLVLYGEGLGGSIGAEVALRHPQIAGLILDHPAAPALEQVAADRRTGLLPVRLLFADRFDLAAKLKILKTPKLFLETQVGGAGEIRPPYLGTLYRSAADPKRLIPAQGEMYFDGMRRFLDESRPAREVH